MKDKLFPTVRDIALRNTKAYIRAKLFIKYICTFIVSCAAGIGLFLKFEVCPFVFFRSVLVFDPATSSADNFLTFYNTVISSSSFDMAWILAAALAAFTVFGGLFSTLICLSRGVISGMNLAHTYQLLRAQHLSLGSASCFLWLVLSEIAIGILLSVLCIESETFSLGSRHLTVAGRQSELLRALGYLVVSFFSSMGAVLILNGIWIVIA